MKIIATMVVIYCLVFAGFCQKAKKNYEDIVKQSAKMQIYGLKIAGANLTLYTEGSISVDTLAELNPLTATFFDWMKKYRTVLKEARQFVQSDGTLPQDRLEAVNVIFEQVVKAFEAAVVVFGLKNILTPQVRTYIDIIRAAIAASRMLFSDARDLLRQKEANYATA
jgi:hypothetical protein